MIKLIIFDLGNVLLKDTGIINNDIGHKLSNISYQSMYDANFETELDELCNEYHYDKEYLIEQLKNYFRTRYKLNLTPQEIQTLSCKYKLGIGSNFISNILCNLDSVKEYFDLIFISGAMEVEKPNREFFERIIYEASFMGIFKSEILFIDDKPENINMAKEVGMHTLLYNNLENSENLLTLIEMRINDFINHDHQIIYDNNRINSQINHIKHRPQNILKEKLRRQQEATYNENSTIAGLPVYDTYGIAPTVPDTTADKEDRLRELDNEIDNYPYQEDLAFNEELLMGLTHLTIPLSEDDKYPVYILLSYGETMIGKIIKKATHTPYSHAAIAFDSELKSLYSFTREGFVHENIRDKKTYAKVDNYKYSLYVLFVNENQLRMMDVFLNKISTSKNKMKYNLIGLLFNYLNKEKHTDETYFCSQFVATIIRMADNSKVINDPSLYAPYDLRKISGCFFVQRGYLKNYSYKNVEAKTEKIKNILFKSIKSEGILHNYIRTTDNESLILRYRKLNYKEEYNKSHKLVKIYKKTGDIESIKKETAKLWAYYLILEEIYIQKGKNQPEFRKTQEYKDAIVAKAFILGDVKDNIEYITSIDKTFNFSKYYEESFYNKDVLVITKKDIKSIIKLISSIL